MSVEIVQKLASHYQKFPVSIVDSMRDSENYAQLHSNLFNLLDEQILENILKHNGNS